MNISDKEGTIESAEVKISEGETMLVPPCNSLKIAV